MYREVQMMKKNNRNSESKKKTILVTLKDLYKVGMDVLNKFLKYNLIYKCLELITNGEVLLESKEFNKLLDFLEKID